jgi:hypothetical protein
MSWLFSQALVAAYSEASSLDGTQSALSNTTPTPQAFLSRDKTTDAWSRFPSGMTCEPLTESRGEELLTWFRAGFLAKTYRRPARGGASTQSAVACGEKWLGSLAKYDRNSRSWKTPQCSLLEGLDEFSETWPRWGMMRDGECWVRPLCQEECTDDKECGLQQRYYTPTARDYKGQSGAGLRQRHGQIHNLADCLGGVPNPTFSEWLMGWPIEWTDLKPLATDKFQRWQHSHGVCSEGQQMTEVAA